MPPLPVVSEDFHLIEMEGDVTIRDTELGARLEMMRPENVRKHIEDHRDELLYYGRLIAHQENEKTKSGKNKTVTAYYLNEGQALTICIFVKSRVAAKVRQSLVVTFMAYRRGNLLNPSETAFREAAEKYYSDRLHYAAFDLIEAKVASNINDRLSRPYVPNGFMCLKEFLDLQGVMPIKPTLLRGLSRDVRKFCAHNAYQIVENAGKAFRSGVAFPRCALDEWWLAHGKAAAKHAAHKTASTSGPLFEWADTRK